MALTDINERVCRQKAGKYIVMICSKYIHNLLSYIFKV